MCHAADATGTVSAPVLDRHAPDHLWAEAQAMMRKRLAREEVDACVKLERGPDGEDQYEMRDTTDP